MQTCQKWYSPPSTYDHSPIAAEKGVFWPLCAKAARPENMDLSSPRCRSQAYIAVMELTLIDTANQARTETTVSAYPAGGSVFIRTADLERATGFIRKPEGLCIDDLCFPVRSSIDGTIDGRPAIDLGAVAATLGRPLVVDMAAGVAVMGAGDVQRSQSLKSGMAPDFSLPDLDGNLHTLSDYRDRKVALYAYASW